MADLKREKKAHASSHQYLPRRMYTRTAVMHIAMNPHTDWVTTRRLSKVTRPGRKRDTFDLH